MGASQHCDIAMCLQNEGVVWRRGVNGQHKKKPETVLFWYTNRDDAWTSAALAALILMSHRPGADALRKYRLAGTSARLRTLTVMHIPMYMP